MCIRNTNNLSKQSHTAEEHRIVTFQREVKAFHIVYFTNNARQFNMNLNEEEKIRLRAEHAEYHALPLADRQPWVGRMGDIERRLTEIDRAAGIYLQL